MYGRMSWTNFTASIDGTSLNGQVEELKLPDLKIKSEEFRAAGMDGPVGVDMGMEGMEVTLTVMSWSPDMLRNLGMGIGSSIPITVRGALRDELTNVTSQAMYKLQGRVMGINGAQLKAGERPKLELSINVHRYEHLVNKETVLLIDLVNMIRFVGGVDQLAPTRLALGV
jgi:P2 family phage contractile tail tube protein